MTNWISFPCHKMVNGEWVPAEMFVPEEYVTCPEVK